MPVIQSQASQEQLLRAVEQLTPEELDGFVANVVALRAAKLAPNLPADEAALLERINAGLSTADQQRFDDLVGKRQHETLTPAEYAELLALTEQIEQRDADRVAALTDLARVRQTSIRALMQALGIQPPAYV